MKAVINVVNIKYHPSVEAAYKKLESMDDVKAAKKLHITTATFHKMTSTERRMKAIQLMWQKKTEYAELCDLPKSIALPEGKWKPEEIKKYIEDVCDAEIESYMLSPDVL